MLRGERWLRPFGGAEAGNVGMMWALLAAFTVGLTGLTVDFTRAQMIPTLPASAPPNGRSQRSPRNMIPPQSPPWATSRYRNDVNPGL